MKKIVSLLFLIISLSINAHGQTQHTIDSLEKVKQACLDKGVGMIHCVAVFRRQMDSLITLSYQKLYAKGNVAAKLALEKDQQHWLKKQKMNDHRIDSIYDQPSVKAELEGLASIITFGERTDFVRNRARYLVKKLNSR